MCREKSFKNFLVDLMLKNVPKINKKSAKLYRYFHTWFIKAVWIRVMSVCVIAQVSDVASVPLLLIPAKTPFIVRHFSSDNVHTALWKLLTLNSCIISQTSLTLKWFEWPSLHKITRTYYKKYLYMKNTFTWKSTFACKTPPSHSKTPSHTCKFKPDITTTWYEKSTILSRNNHNMI